MEIRSANIAIAVGAVILFAGGFLVRDAGDGAMQVVGFLALIATFGTLTVLLERKERRRKRRERPQ